MHLTVFRNTKRADVDIESYAADSARMIALAEAQPGFIAYRRYSSADGEDLSLSEWETEADARAWARHPEHVAVQGKGRSAYYETYSVYSCPEPSIRTFERDKP